MCVSVYMYICRCEEIYKKELADDVMEVVEAEKSTTHIGKLEVQEH